MGDERDKGNRKAGCDSGDRKAKSPGGNRGFRTANNYVVLTGQNNRSNYAKETKK